MKSMIKFVYLFILVVVFSGCNEGQPVEPEHSVALTDFLISPASISLVDGGMPDAQQITVTLVPEDATDVTFTWSSGNTSVATVSQTGLVTAAGVGTAQISVVANDKIRKIVTVKVEKTRLPGTFRSPVYLQNPATDGMTVMWVANVPCQSWVEYGTDSLNMHRNAQIAEDGLSKTNSTDNRIRLTGLQPGTRYFYRAFSREVIPSSEDEFGPVFAGKISSFTTFDNENTDFTALIFNDLHDNHALFSKLYEQVKDIPYDIVFFNGDNIADSPTKEFALLTLSTFCHVIGADKIPSIFVRGNHESSALNGAYTPHLYDELLGKAAGEEHYGGFNIGDTRFVVLDFGDDNDHSIQLRPIQREFLITEIRSNAFQSAARRVLIHHIPVYGIPATHPWSCFNAWGDVLAVAPFDICLNAHQHYFRNIPKGEVGNNFPVVWGGGPDEQSGTVMVLRKQGTTMTLTVLNAQGGTLLSLNL